MRKIIQSWFNYPTSDSSSEKLTEEVTTKMSQLIKMKDATILLKASAPTVRKYARLGYYKEYRLGPKLVFFDKIEIINFIKNGGSNV